MTFPLGSRRLFLCDNCFSKQITSLSGLLKTHGHGSRCVTVRNYTVYIKDPYKVLGVRYTANGAEIKAAYFLLSKKFHPDVNKSPEAAKKFSEISSAYEILSKEDSRKQFDKKFDIDSFKNYQIHVDRFEEDMQASKETKRFAKRRVSVKETTHRFTEQDVLRVQRVYSSEDFNSVTEDQWIRDHFLQDECGRYRDIRYNKERKKFAHKDSVDIENKIIFRKKVNSILILLTLIVATVLSIVYRN